MHNRARIFIMLSIPILFNFLFSAPSNSIEERRKVSASRLTHLARIE